MKKNKSITITRLIFKNFVICLSLLMAAIWFFSYGTDAALNEYIEKNTQTNGVNIYEGTQLSDQELEESNAQVIILDEQFNIIEKLGTEILTQDNFTSLEITQIVANIDPYQTYYASFMPVTIAVEQKQPDYEYPQEDVAIDSAKIQENEATMTSVAYTIATYPENDTQGTYALMVQNDYLASDKYAKAINVYVWGNFFGNALLILLVLILFVRLTYKPLKRDFRVIEENIIKTPYESSHIDKNIATLKEAQSVLESYNMMIDAVNNEAEQKEKAFEQNSQLISNLAHDLKSPITVLKGYSEVLLTTDLDKKERNEYASYIAKSANDLNNLISLLFEQIKYQKSECKMNFENADINAVLRDVCANYYMMFDQCGFKFESDIAEEGYHTLLDIVSIKRVFTNLLQNILNHNKIPTEVLVSSRITDKFIEIKIKDNGVGVSQQNKDKIFDAFFQEDTSRNKQNSGLGLYICKEIIKKHNGTIFLQNTADEQEYKTVFVIRIP